ncbi:hypothetical protein CI238_03852 [Colletotrichum incanum]|uniref:Uncharacterized protein n=1 Tax=Colletotrichum incanum TaxID=1573173 RepID=A0A162PNA1_COLIC|nr:hypothetical protein CI238_03852 [Colletotrichum incanum]
MQTINRPCGHFTEPQGSQPKKPNLRPNNSQYPPNPISSLPSELSNSNTFISLRVPLAPPPLTSLARAHPGSNSVSLVSRRKSRDIQIPEPRKNTQRIHKNAVSYAETSLQQPKKRHIVQLSYRKGNGRGVRTTSASRSHSRTPGAKAEKEATAACLEGATGSLIRLEKEVGGEEEEVGESATTMSARTHPSSRPPTSPPPPPPPPPSTVVHIDHLLRLLRGRPSAAQHAAFAGHDTYIALPLEQLETLIEALVPRLVLHAESRGRKWPTSCRGGERYRRSCGEQQDSQRAATTAAAECQHLETSQWYRYRITDVQYALAHSPCGGARPLNLLLDATK